MDRDPPELSDTTPEGLPRPERVEAVKRWCTTVATGLETIAVVWALVNGRALRRLMASRFLPKLSSWFPGGWVTPLVD